METTIKINWKSNYNNTGRDIRKITERVVSKLADGEVPPFKMDVMTMDDEFNVYVEVEQK